METVSQILDKYNTDKNSSHHNYGRQYEDVFRNFRDKNIKYLEIGVFNGGSIKSFREIFKHAECIVGIDINEDCKQYEDLDSNIHVEIGDATDHKFLQYITDRYGNFDVILDDGSHNNVDVIKSFELLFPLLNDNGVYVVEDTACYQYHWNNDHTYPNHIQYFVNFLHFLNQASSNGSSNPYKINKTTSNIFEASIDKIEFGCSYIAIHKKLRTHWIGKSE
jgi:hypothetical protein